MLAGQVQFAGAYDAGDVLHSLQLGLLVLQPDVIHLVGALQPVGCQKTVVTAFRAQTRILCEGIPGLIFGIQRVGAPVAPVVRLAFCRRKLVDPAQHTAPVVITHCGAYPPFADAGISRRCGYSFQPHGSLRVFTQCTVQGDTL